MKSLRKSLSANDNPKSASTPSAHGATPSEAAPQSPTPLLDHKAPRPMWWRFYFALAAFDLITISFSLYLNHRLMGMHQESVRVNQEWAERLSQFSDLAQLGGEVNAPGNDVFDSHDVAAESGRLRVALNRFEVRLAQEEADVLRHVASEHSANLREDLALIRDAMKAMVGEADLIFSFFRNGQPEKAGERMATMDRAYAKLNGGFARLGRHVRAIQAGYFRKQQLESESLRHYEYLIAGAIVLMVTAVTIYGHRMARAMTAMMQEKERYLDELRDAHDELERRVQERTSDLREEILQRKQAQKEVEEAQARLVISSHQAGMAEIATSVLHNVGNVLTSVNVSAEFIAEQLRASKTSTLAKALAMVRAHKENLGDFLVNDPKGKMLPALLEVVLERITQEQAKLTEETKGLQQNIDHIKQIVSMQQSYAKVSGAMEQLAVQELVEDALRMSSIELSRHQVEVVREFDPVPPVLVSRHSMLQILINLVNNAKQALDSRLEGRRLTLRISQNENGRVRVQVEDNGAGIAAENLTKIFQHGFTTKKSGHGFGLHSAANAAQEMGGFLAVRSDGLGTGATFILELPQTQILRSEKAA